MQTSYVIRLAAWLPDCLHRLRRSLPAAEVTVWDYSQDPRVQGLVSDWGWQWQAQEGSTYGHTRLGAGLRLLDADEVWPLELPAQPPHDFAEIVSADGLLHWQEQRQLTGTLQKQPLSQQEQAELLTGLSTGPQWLLALEHQLTPLPEPDFSLLSTLPLAMQLRCHLRLINSHLLAQQSGKAWQALQAAFQLFPAEPLLAALLSSLLAYIGQEAAFQQAERLRSQGNLSTSGLGSLSLASGPQLAQAAELVLPQARQSRAERLLPLPPTYPQQKAWLNDLWQASLAWQDALPAPADRAAATLSYSPMGSLACHSLLYEAGRQPQVSPELGQALFGLGRQALAQQDLQSTERAWVLALSNRMSGHWKLRLIFRYLLEWLQADRAGDLVELGCNAGQSSVLIDALRQAFQSQKGFRVYDSFAGLPPASGGDGGTPLQAGSMAVSRADFIQTFKRLGQPLPEICQGWFAETLPQQLPEQIGWAYLDSDRYESIALSLQALIPRLQVGGGLLIDDYRSHLFPGVEQACQDYLPTSYRLTHHYLDPFHSMAWVVRT